MGDLGTYGFVLTRCYEPHDLACSELLFVHGLGEPTLTSEESRDQKGRLVLTVSQSQRLRDFGEVRHRIIVSVNARRAVEAANFNGLGFREVTVLTEASVGSAAVCWELVPGLMLPKVANSNRLMYYGERKPEPFSGDYSRMVFVSDFQYTVGEIQYMRRELTGLGPFDIAETFEKLYVPQRSLVISQRLYQHFLQSKVPILVEPVRIC